MVLHLSGTMKYPDGVHKFRENAVSGMAEKNRILLDLEKLECLDSISMDEILKMDRLLRTSGGSVSHLRGK